MFIKPEKKWILIKNYLMILEKIIINQTYKLMKSKQLQLT